MSYYQRNREAQLAKAAIRRKLQDPVAVAAYQASYRVANKARLKEAAKKRSKMPHVRRRVRELDILRKFGLSEVQYAGLLEQQDGCCAICSTDEPKGKGCFCVDHDHVTGEVRGLLCHHCNLGLGNFADDTQRMLKAVEYLCSR